MLTRSGGHWLVAPEGCRIKSGPLGTAEGAEQLGCSEQLLRLECVRLDGDRGAVAFDAKGADRSCLVLAGIPRPDGLARVLAWLPAPVAGVAVVDRLECRGLLRGG